MHQGHFKCFAIIRVGKNIKMFLYLDDNFFILIESVAQNKLS